MSEGVCRRQRGEERAKLCMELARLAGEPDTVGKYVSRGLCGKTSSDDS